MTILSEMQRVRRQSIGGALHPPPSQRQPTPPPREEGSSSQSIDKEPNRANQRRRSTTVGMTPGQRRPTLDQGRRQSIAQRRQSIFQGGEERDRPSISQRRTSIALTENQHRRMSYVYDQYRDLKESLAVSPLTSEDESDISDREEVGLVGTASMRKSAALLQKKIHMKPCPITFKNEFHEIMYQLTESRAFTGFILFIILFNTTILIGQTWLVVSVRGGWYISALDNIFLGIYIMEVVLKLYVWRAKFFNEGWNILDLSIVVFNVIDFVLPLIIQNIGGFNGAAIFRLLRIFRAIRAIRALRVLRTIRFLANLQVIMTTILQSIRSIGAIVTLILLVMYMFAVIGRGLYADVDPNHFGDLFNAWFTLFQLLTLDDWFEINQTITNGGRGDIFFYLFTYIVVEYFIFLNLFVAVLVDNFQLTLQAQNESNKKRKIQQEEQRRKLNEDLLASNVKPSTQSVAGSIAPQTDLKSRKTMVDYYPECLEIDRDRLSQYFKLLASLEYNTRHHAEQQRIVNIMVDICADTNDDL